MKTNDFKAKIGDDYLLRVEQMDRGVWWWCVYYKGNEIASSNMNGDVGRSKNEAMLKCELAAVMHVTNFFYEIDWEEIK